GVLAGLRVIGEGLAGSAARYEEQVGAPVILESHSHPGFGIEGGDVDESFRLPVTDVTSENVTGHQFAGVESSTAAFGDALGGIGAVEHYDVAGRRRGRGRDG